VISLFKSAQLVAFGITALFCLAAEASNAQTAELSVSGDAIWAGSPAMFTLSLRSTSGPTPAAIQWNLEYSPSVITAVRIDSGTAVVAAEKTVICAPNAAGQVCLAMGFNANVISDGPVAVVSATLAPGVTAATIVVTKTIAVSPGGNEILLTAPNGGAGTVTVSPPPLLKPPPK
jgi:hypothetical protein